MLKTFLPFFPAEMLTVSWLSPFILYEFDFSLVVLELIIGIELLFDGCRDVCLL